jgi:hypothetical protein
MNKGEG